MNESQPRLSSCGSSSLRQDAARGQGLVEYAILITVISLIAVLGLTLLGGSVEGGFIRVCAGLGVDDCEVVPIGTSIASTVTAVSDVSPTPSLIPTATATLPEPDPTRAPILTALPIATPGPTIELKTLRIKVVLSGGGKKSPAGIQVVVHNPAGEYVTQGVTDDKGEISFLVTDGNYNVATFYNSAWQNDGPFSTSSSKMNVIHR